MSAGCVSAPIVGSETALTRAPDDQSLQWAPCPPIFPVGCRIAILHGDPAQPNADIFLRLPGGMELPAHTHTSAERIILVSGELQVHYEGQSAAILRTGNYAYGPPNLPHTAKCLSDEPCTLFIAFEQPVDALAHPASER
ncbi:cupin domain-containing protein [bacterium]|nr:cupin domain-containing protein [bacterium]